MKPSHLTQSAAPRLFGLVIPLLTILGCAGGTPQVVGDDDDQPPPPMVKQPPAPKDGSGTAAGCEGVTEAGTCQDGVAVYCDVEGGELRRKDCRALGKSCVVDATTGAKCETVEGGGTGAGGACGSVTNEGSCEAGVATWCDETGSEPQLVQWTCSENNLSCRTDCETSEGTPIPGAFCCGDPSTPPPASNECPALGFEGECNGTTEARWCNGDQLVEQTCTDGKTCQVDPVIGAYCGQPPMSECDTLGFEGRCVAGKPRWCSGGEVMEVTCGTGTQCEENGPDCAAGGGDAGAYCCAP